MFWHDQNISYVTIICYDGSALKTLVMVEVLVFVAAAETNGPVIVFRWVRFRAVVCGNGSGVRMKVVFEARLLGTVAEVDDDDDTDRARGIADTGDGYGKVSAPVLARRAWLVVLVVNPISLGASMGPSGCETEYGTIFAGSFEMNVDLDSFLHWSVNKSNA